jgi:signal transduction histidine kinase
MKTSLAGDVNAPSHARAYVTRQLGTTPVLSGALVDQVVLTASELVTNAVQAGATAIEIDVDVTGERLELVVIDDAGGWPVATRAAVHDTTGRGLSIVAQLADSWDVVRQPRGKSVTATWFDVSGPRGT